MSRRRPSAQDLRDAALEAMENDPERAVGLARSALEREPVAESHYVLALTLLEAEDVDAAMDALHTALELDAEHTEAWVTLAATQFDRCDFDDSRVSVTAALRIDPHHPEALYLRACMRERRGDHDGAARDYQAAALVSPDEFPLPVPLRDEEIEAIADEVIARLHPSLQLYLRDVHILIDEVPSIELLEQFDPPAHPNELLGCFSGHALTERTSADPWSALPATILLFRRNLSRIAGDPDELRDELRITLLHEIGHYLGLDEDDLERRGLD